MGVYGMVLQNYQNFIEMTSNMIYIVAHGGGFKCPRKIHLNTQCPPRPHAFRWPYKGLFVSAIFLLDDGVNYDNTTHKIDHQLLKVH